jgi:hypothetical protein
MRPFRGQRRFLRRHKRPVLRILRALGNPRLDLLFLLGGEARVLLRRRHHLLFIGADDARPHIAVRRIAGLDADEAVALGVGGLRDIEAELSLAPFLIEAVARETVFGEDRFDVAAVVDGDRQGRGTETRSNSQSTQETGVISREVMKGEKAKKSGKGKAAD